jgi:hypothetical protein
MEGLYDTNANNFYANQYHQNAAAMAAFYLNGRTSNNTPSTNLLPLKNDYSEVNSFQFGSNVNYSNINSPSNIQKPSPYFTLTPPLSISSNLSSTPSSCSSTSSINTSSTNDYLTRHNNSQVLYNQNFQYQQHSPIDHTNNHMMINQANNSMQSRNRTQNTTKDHSLTFSTSTPSNSNESNQSNQQASFETSSDMDSDNSKMIKSPKRQVDNNFNHVKTTSFITPSLMSIEVCQRRKRRQRTQFSKYQLGELEKLFQSTRYPDIYCREDLSARIGIPESRIQVWFKNRRSKIRKDEKSDVEHNLINSNSRYNSGEDYSDEHHYDSSITSGQE